MQSAKEKASNITASAKAGMEKTKATVQEKAERMTARDPLQKEMATEKKEERIHEAERQKHEDREHNAATRHAAAAGGGTFGHDYTTAGGGALSLDYTATTGGDYSTGTTGADYTAEGGVRSDYPQGTTADVVGSQYPTAQTTGGAGRVGRQDPNARTGYGTGRTY